MKREAPRPTKERSKKHWQQRRIMEDDVEQESDEEKVKYAKDFVESNLIEQFKKLEK